MKWEEVFETIIVEKRDQVAGITLNRPEALNACNDVMGRELQKALRELEADAEVKCLTITGAGRAFCAGEDIPGFRTVNERYGGIGGLLRQKYHPIIQRIHDMDKPVIAGLNGIAAGGGASLALACDLRIASGSASIKMAFIGMGLAPDAGSSYFLSRMIGTARAMDLILTGRTVNAEEAESIGLVSAVTEPEKLDGAVQDLAMKLAESPSKALAFSKRLVNKPVLSLAEALENEATLQDILGHTGDHAEAVKAFLEKRKPRFTGN